LDVDHGKHGITTAVEVFPSPLVEGSETPLYGTQKKNVQIAVEGGVSEGDRVAVARECCDTVYPGLRRHELQGDFNNDARRSPRVKDEPDVLAGKRNDTWLLFYGHDPERLDHPGVANDPV